MDCPTHLRIGYPDWEVFPFFNGRGADIPADPGDAVLWAGTAIAQTGCHPIIEFARYPQRRLNALVSNGAVDIRLGGARIQDADQQWAFPDDADGAKAHMNIGEMTIIFITRPGVTIPNWESRHQLPPGTTVGVVRDSIVEQIGQQRGWRLDSTSDIASNFTKLIAGHVAVIAEPWETTAPIIQRLPPGQVVTIQPPIVTIPYYSPVNRSFYDKYPAFTERYWLSLCQQSRARFPQFPACMPIR